MKEWPRAIATVGIWMALAFTLGNGLFKMRFSGNDATVFFLPLLLTAIVVTGATVATRAVWRRADEEKEPPEKPEP